MAPSVVMCRAMRPRGASLGATATLPSLPATVLMGAAFPLAAALAHDGEDREGRTVAMVYSANILGNVAGGLCTGLLHRTEMPSFGLQSQAEYEEERQSR